MPIIATVLGIAGAFGVGVFVADNVPTLAAALVLIGLLAGLMPAAYLFGWKTAHLDAHKDTDGK